MMVRQYARSAQEGHIPGATLHRFVRIAKKGKHPPMMVRQCASCVLRAGTQMCRRDADVDHQAIVANIVFP